MRRTGERRLSAIIERFGAETLAAARDEIFAQTERLERLAIGEIPDGVYEAEGALDNDGLSEAPGGACACASRSPAAT